ncbi:MAG: hypothetical protein AAB244_06900 [Nitrospirota bacterium]|jgi:hypothetical protein
MEIDLNEEIKKASRDGKLSCLKAFELAERLRLPVNNIGKAAEGLNVKIVSCQLGCF